MTVNIRIAELGWRGVDDEWIVLDPHLHEEEAVNVIELIRENHGEIIDGAAKAIKRAHLPHYELATPDQVRQRLTTLCDLTLECLQANNTGPILEYVAKIAGERFFTGYTLRELQTAFNLLEESIWDQIFSKMQVDEATSAVTTVDAPLRVGKEEVARTYISLLSKRKVSTFDPNMDP
jgi:hypothetical protein